MLRRIQSILCPCFGPKTFKVGDLTLIEVRPIGEGGYSFVILVEDTATGTRMALKKMLAQSPQQLKEAMWEVEVLKKLRETSNPHIIRIHDSSVIPAPNDITQVLILLEFFPRGSMFDVIEANAASKRFLSETQLLRMFLDCCNAVLALHTQNPPWVHNDIKPGNFLLANNDRCVLTDFGSVSPARVVVKSRVQAMQLQDFIESHSTPAYRPPELFDVPSDCSIDERTDVWSLGCLLFAFAFGKSPFESSITEQGGSLALAVASGRFRIPDSHPYSEVVTNLIALMLQPEISNRPFIPDLIRTITNAI